MTGPGSPARPPRFAARLFRFLFPGGGLEPAAGDLEEIFSALAAEDGPAKARRWYWGQLLNALPHRLVGFLYLDVPMFILSLKIMGRSLRKHKSFSALTVAALVLGLTSFLTTYLFVQYESTYDSFHEDADRLYKVVLGTASDPEMAKVPPLDVRTTISQVPEIDDWAQTCYAFDPIALSEGRKIETRGLFAGESFLRMFSFPVLRGSARALDEPFKVLVTEAAGRNLFGQEDPLGRTVELIIRGERCGVTVAGIVSDLPRHTTFAFDLLISLPTARALPRLSDLIDVAPHLFRTYVKVGPKSSAAAGAAKIAALLNRQSREPDPKSRLACSLQPLSDLHLRPSPDDNRAVRAVYFYLSLGFLVLVIAVINYVNLSTARSSIRMREIGVRKTFGALRRQLVRQFVGEAVALTVVSFVLSLAAIGVILPAFNRLMGTGIGLGMLGRGTLGLEVAAIVLLIGAAAGLYPALVLSSPQPVRVLKAASAPLGEAGPKSFRPRNALVVAQFAAALILVILTNVIHGQIRFIRTKDVGFLKGGVVETWAPSPQGKIVKAKLLQNPKVSGVTMASNAVSLSSRNTPDAEWGDPVEAQDGFGAPVEFRAHQLYCDRDFIPVFDIRLAAGRNFSEGPTETGSVIVNETFARRLGPGSALGGRIRVGGRDAAIVGVVADFHVQPFTQAIRPVVLSPTESNFGLLYAKTRNANREEALEIVGHVLDEVYPEDILPVTFLEDRLISVYQAERKQAALLSAFSALAVVIAGLGLFGLAAFAAERRTKEFGIRKVLGAGTTELLGLISLDFCRLALFATLIGLPPSVLFVHLWLRNFAYHIPVRPVSLLLAGLGMLGLMLLTAGTQIHRISRIDPVKTLKYE